MKKEILIPLGIVLISIASIYSLVNTNLTTKQEYEQHITLARQASKNGTIKRAVKEYKEAIFVLVVCAIGTIIICFIPSLFR